MKNLLKSLIVALSMLAYGNYYVYSTCKVSISVFDEKTNKGISSEIIQENMSDYSTSNYSTDRSGSIILEINPGKYVFYFTKKGYWYSKHIEIISDTSKFITLQKVNLKPVESKMSATFGNLKFDLNSIELSPDNKLELKVIADIINESDEYLVKISGHSDNLHDLDTNTMYSKLISETFTNYLIRLCNNNSNIFSSFKGSIQPIVPNNSASNSAKNRRVQITLIKKD